MFMPKEAAMRLFATLIITLIVVALVAIFVWGWYEQGKIIPEVIFGGLLTLVASLVSFMWLRNPSAKTKSEHDPKE
jgi:uncharacterized membrane protein